MFSTLVTWTTHIIEDTTLPLQLNMQWWIQDFPLGGTDPVGGHQPPTRTLFGKNVCENERN